MNKNLIAEIFVPLRGSGGTEGEIATGYPIGRDLILTARHPLFPESPGRDDDYPIEVRWRHPDVDPERWWPVEIAWDSAQWDLALLSCGLPAAISPWAGFLSEQRPLDTMEWVSAGFARVGGEKSGLRRAFHMKGSVFSMLDTDAEFPLEATAGPAVDEDWKGASGCPVVVNGRIIGVVVSVPDKVSAKRLLAVPMWRVLREDAAFRRVVGYDEQQARRTRVQQRLSQVLSTSSAALDALAGQIPGAADALRMKGLDEKARYVADRLLSSEIEQVVRACKAAHADLTEAGEDVAAITRTVQIVLPAVYDHGVVETVRSARGDVTAALLTLPVRYPTVAEIIMAGVDRRETLFCPREREDDFPKGRLNLPEPPEQGFDGDGQRALASLNEHLAGKFGWTKAEPFMAAVDEFMVRRFRTPAGVERTPEQKIKAAAREIQYQAKLEGRTYYLIVNLPADPQDRGALEETLRTLRGRYPGLMCLSLNTEWEVEEADFRNFRPLLPLLPRVAPRPVTSPVEVSPQVASTPADVAAERTRMRTIYLSSTYQDLQEYREAVFDALRQSGYTVIAMEDYVARDDRPVDACLADVDRSGIYVGLFALRYGYCPPPEHGNPEGLSITELEFRRADANPKIHCLTFLLDEKKASWSPAQIDAFTGENDAGGRIKALREELAREKMASFFTTPHDLASKVQSAITKLLGSER